MSFVTFEESGLHFIEARRMFDLARAMFTKAADQQPARRDELEQGFNDGVQKIVSLAAEYPNPVMAGSLVSYFGRQAIGELADIPGIAVSAERDEFLRVAAQEAAESRFDAADKSTDFLETGTGLHVHLSSSDLQMLQELKIAL